MRVMDVATEYVTSDSWLAAYLWCLGHRPVRIEGVAPRRKLVFKDVPQEVPVEFYADRATVNPLTFGRAYKDLLRLLHQP